MELHIIFYTSFDVAFDLYKKVLKHWYLKMPSLKDFNVNFVKLCAWKTMETQIWKLSTLSFLVFYTINFTRFKEIKKYIE